MVAPAVPRRLPALAEWIRGRNRSVLRELVSVVSRPGILSLAGGLPDPELFPTDHYAAALAHVLDHDDGALQYKPPFGPLKQHIARLMARRGAPCTPEQVLLTTGAQQGICIAISLLLERSEPVVLEAATYPGLIEALAPFTPRCLTVGTDLDSGMDVEEVEGLLSRGARPAFIYAIPDGHNPYGVSLSRAKRLRLVELARHHHIPIVEDDPYGLLTYDGAVEPPLRALDEDWVLYLGTFSKTIAPALRLGWMVLPADLMQAAAIVKEAGDLESSALTERAVSFCLQNGFFSAHVRRLRDVYRIRRDALLGALERHFPRDARWTRPHSGFFVWVELPAAVDCAALLNVAIEEERVAFVPGHAFAAGGVAARNCMRLSFASCSPDEIEEGVRRLARLVSRRIAHG